MDASLTVWYCDHCGKRIENVKSGYVVWMPTGVDEDNGFQIIHVGQCDDNSRDKSSALEDFLGENGLAYLTSFLSAEPLFGGKNSMNITDFNEFIDFFRPEVLKSMIEKYGNS